MLVHNLAEWDSEIQLFGKAGCGVSMRRLSRFESVADFARHNGMCSFRDWYHYRNATADWPAFDFLKSVPDRLVLRTDRGDAQSLEQLGVLRTLAHQCDRSYQHTDFEACAAAATVTSAAGSAYAAQPVRAARTWRLEDGVWNARFCALQGGEASGFLSPYPEGALLSAARDIRRCSKLGLCPSTRFHVRGRAVEARRVRVHELSEDSPNGVASTNAARDYCGLDAQRCWGMGHLLGKDCADLDRQASALCVVDALVLPLLAVAYRQLSAAPSAPSAAPSAALDTRLTELRRDCPRAFTQAVGGRQDAALFAHVHNLLTQPYAWTDSARRQQVLEHANGLFFMLFGERGFASIDRYLAHAQCAAFVARQRAAAGS